MAPLYSKPEDALEQIKYGRQNCLYQLDSSFCENKSFLLNIFGVVSQPEHFYMASQSLQNDRDFVARSLEANTNMFRYFPDSFKNDRQIAARAAYLNANNFVFISPSLRGDPQFVKILLEVHSGLVHEVNRMYELEKTSDTSPLIINEDEAIVAISNDVMRYNQCSVALKNNINILQATLLKLPARYTDFNMNSIFESITIRVNCILMHAHTQKRLSIPVFYHDLLQNINFLAAENLKKEFEQDRNQKQSIEPGTFQTKLHKKPSRI